MNKEQYNITTAYNLFINNLVLWHGLYNRLKVEEEQGYKPVKNYNKMIELKEKAISLLPSIEKIDRESIRSFFPLVDDLALIKLFKDTYNV